MDLVPVDNSSGVAALRGDVAPVLPWNFRSPLLSAGADENITRPVIDFFPLGCSRSPSYVCV
ncbi:hypothetical protein C9Z70_25970 (plasmid) [Escherichia coli]|nr:hypothetical protein AW074_23855 [Escherichia coli]TJE55726.1 hypothetical protein C9216_26675 [Escherichia coli]TJP93884.1 hypothetical protein C9Z70_25970 [Escherichia coli]